MNHTSFTRLDHLGRERPDWRPWLGVLARALREAVDPAWEISLPRPPAPVTETPLLAGAEVRLDGSLVQGWVGTLFEAAADAGAGAGLHLEASGALALVTAVIQEDGPRMAALAMAHRWPAEPFHAVAALAALPLLQAVGRRWAHAIPPTWRRGYCPICGAWPALAETRGVERKRWLRCARCGSDWETDFARCAFCDNRDSGRLGLLVEADGGARRHVETCAVCRGYLKALTTLRAGPAVEVILDDLVSVDLDVAALGQGYARPPGHGRLLGLRLAERVGLARRLLEPRT